MKQMFLGVVAVLDMALVYGALRLMGFKPSPVAVVVGVAVLYAAVQVYLSRRQVRP